MTNVDFIAIDFETATGYRASVCEAGICIVRGGEIVGTRSWLVCPPDNYYWERNIEIHGITPADTEDAPEFPAVWQEIAELLNDCPVLVAHNAAFDMGCIRQSLDFYGLSKPDVTYYCSCRAARRIYQAESHSLGFLCDKFGISYDQHHRAGCDAEMCARLFLKEMEDAAAPSLESMDFCGGKL